MGGESGAGGPALFTTFAGFFSLQCSNYLIQKMTELAVNHRLAIKLIILLTFF